MPILFLDVCDDTVNNGPAPFDATATPRTKAVMPVHVAGLACDVDPILQLVM